MHGQTHVLYRKCGFIINRFLSRPRQEGMPMSPNILLISLILIGGETEEEGNDEFCQSITLTSYASQLQYVGDICHAVGISKHFCYTDGMPPVRTKGGT